MVRGFQVAEPFTLASNLGGDYVLAGTHNESETTDKAALVVAPGAHGKLKVAQTVVSGELAGQKPPVGIDAAGDAVVLWNEDGKTRGAQGMFAAMELAEP